MTLTAPERLGDEQTKNVAHLSMTIDRDALAEAVKEGKREISGLAVPYDVEIARSDWYYGTSKLKIGQDAATVREDAKLFFGHDHIALGTPIGRITGWANEPGGLRITAALSKTAKADEVYELLQDGTLDKFSIGFYYVAFSIEDDGELLVHTEIDVFETSVVSYPAFDGAAVDSVLSATNKGNRMTQLAAATFSKEDGDKLATSIDTLSTDVEQLAAKLATIGNADPAGPPPLAFSSYGEFVKAMCDRDHDKHGEAEALTKYLAYEGGVVADTTYGDTWVGDITRRIERARKVWNLFESGTLPAEGMKLEYGRVVNSTIDVARQLAEGDKIVMGKIEVGSEFADVITFGGGAEMSFQQVKRSSINVVDFTWGELARAYAKATEAYARLVLDSVVPHTVASACSRCWTPQTAGSTSLSTPRCTSMTSDCRPTTCA
ncbi:HK97 family phage prohead protease [Aeromicrobium sp.]|uniref:HK97 family phage prohead protease n=1 Tax=Aeromicrobium sp. TaxID=1871063 RepID=UPI0030C2AB3E